MKNKNFAIALLVILTVLYFVAQIKQSHKKSQDGINTNSKSPLGLSIAKTYLSDQVQLNKKAFHDYLDLKAYDMIAVHSPKFPLSLYEIETLKTYAYEGGNLLFTALTEDDYKRLNLQSLVATKETKKSGDKYVKAAKDKTFKNGETTEMPWPGMQTIKHYSAIHWVEVIEKKDLKDNKEKNKSYLDPEEVHLVHNPEYLLQWPLGRGSVTVLLGVPPYANSMLQFSENQDFLKLLKRQYPNIMWDVYHHYVKQAGLSDLFKDIQVVVPILGFVLFVLLYFFMSPQKTIENTEQENEQIPSYHEFYEGLFSSLFKYDKGREDAYAFFHKKIEQLYGLKQDKLVQTGQMDNEEFILKWNKSVNALSKHLKISKD